MSDTSRGARWRRGDDHACVLGQRVGARDRRHSIREWCGYAGSLAPSTSSGSMAGGTANSAGACALRGCAIGPARWRFRPDSSANASKMANVVTSIDHDVAPEALGLFDTDVLADFFQELFFRLPRTVFLELAHHSLTGARDAEE